VRRLIGPLAVVLLAATAPAADLLIVDGSASVRRRDPDGLTGAAARLLLLALPAERPVCIYGLDATSRFRSEGRHDAGGRKAALEALARAGTVAAAHGDLALVLEQVTTEEQLTGLDRVYLITDGYPSLTLAEWGERYGQGEAELVADASAWYRSAQAAHERRLAQVVGRLGSQGVELWWIAPRGRQPGSGLAAEITRGGGQVLAGSGLNDLTRLMGQVLGAGAGGQTLEAGAEERQLWVPPAVDQLDVLFAKPASGLLRLTSPLEETYILGLGVSAGRERIPLPVTGTWTLVASLPSVAHCSLSCQLQLVPEALLSAPGLAGSHRLASVSLCDGAGRPVDPSGFEAITVVLRWAGASRTLERRGDRWLADLRLPERAGELRFKLEATLRHGAWSTTIRREVGIQVYELQLQVDLGGTALPAAQSCRIAARVLRDGVPWPAARGELFLDGLGRSRRPLHRQDGGWFLELQSLAAGDYGWQVSGDILVPEGAVPLSARGDLAVGDVTLRLEGTTRDGRWAGMLVARSTLPIPVRVAVGHELRRNGGGQSVQGKGLELIVEPGDVGVRAPVEVVPPAGPGTYVGRLHAEVVDDPALGATEVELRLEVPGWWSLWGWWALLWISGLGLGGLVVGWVWWHRPRLQGEILVEDREGRPMIEAVQLGRRHPLGRRRETLGSPDGVDHRIDAPGGVGVWRLRLTPRRGDLGLVWACLENLGEGTVTVAEQALPPGERRVLQHDDRVRIGPVVLRYRQPLLSELTYHGGSL
jgi:hypothetical protein